jgi:putative inorganic carbon (HCO3(-)) transporter
VFVDLHVDESRGVPATRRSDRHHPSAVWCFVAALITDVFSGHSQYLGLPISPDRLFFAAGFLLLVLDRRRPLRALRLRPVHLVAVLVVVVAGLSALAFGTLTSSLGFFALLDRLLVPYLMFTLAPLIFLRAGDRLLLLKLLSCLGIYLGVTAIGEVFGPHAVVFPRYILDPQVGIQFGRARGPFTESEANGLTMVAALHCALALFRVSSRPLWRRLAALSVALSLVGCLLTLTRSIWLGTVLGLLLVALLDRRVRKLVSVVALAAAILVPSALLASESLSTSAASRFTDAGPVNDRRNTNAAALRAIEAHPLTGVGWTRFIDVSYAYVRQSDRYPVTHINIEVHNVVLSRAAELGIPGGALWVLSVALGPGAAALRRSRTARDETWRAILVGTGAAWTTAVLSSPVPYPLPNTLVWLFAGLAASAVLLRRSEAPPDEGTAY